jgi:hypothetical protein
VTHRGRLPGSLRAVLVHGVVLGVALAASGAAPWVAPAHAGTTSTSPACASVAHPFTPTTLAIEGVLRTTKVLARGQDRYGVPQPPPLTDRGKWQLAWDKASKVRPGDAAGVVRLTAHTYPRAGSRQPALGNLLLARLRTGAHLTVTGRGGEQLCYRVSRRQQVRATDSLAGYYDTTGAPRLAILVCSGTRRGPGDWTHRTIWYATPVTPT